MSYRSRPLEVAQQLHIEFGITNPPINPGLITPNYPIRITLEDWAEDLSGMFVRGHKTCYIGLNKNDPITRRHFTLWHEFYHYLEHTSVYVCRFGMRDIRPVLDKEADLFAVHFLMPDDWVKDAFYQDKGNTIAMARRFTVSSTAMNRRIKDLRLK